MKTLKLLILLLIIVLFLPIPLSNTQAQFLLIHKLKTILDQEILITDATLRILPTTEMHIASMQLVAQKQTIFQAEEILLPIDVIEWLLGGNASITELLINKIAIQLTSLLAVANEFDVFNTDKLPPIHIEHVSFGHLEENNLAVTIDANQEDAIQLKFIHNTDTLNIKVARAGKALLLDMNAAQWHFGTLDKLQFTHISGTGRITVDKLELERFQATLDAGYVHGVLRFTRDNIWNTTGSLTFESIPSEAVMTWINLPVLQGQTTGTIFLNSSGHNVSELITAASISGQLQINDGTLHGIDLITPARSLTIGDSKGGETPFINLKLDVERQHDEWLMTFTGLHSNDITSNGVIRLNEGLLLDGVMNMNLPQANTVPLLITGSIFEALVRVAR